jgi:hypothetical protein
MSLAGRLGRIETLVSGHSGGSRPQDVTLYFAVFCPAGPHSRPGLESYYFFDWSLEGDPPPEIHGHGCNMPVEHLAALAGEGYVIELLHDPERPFCEATPWIQIPIPDNPIMAHHLRDLPTYTEAHITHWAGYRPGAILEQVLDQREAATRPT